MVVSRYPGDLALWRGVDPKKTTSHISRESAFIFRPFDRTVYPKDESEFPEWFFGSINACLALGIWPASDVYSVRTYGQHPYCLDSLYGYSVTNQSDGNILLTESHESLLFRRFGHCFVPALASRKILDPQGKYVAQEYFYSNHVVVGGLPVPFGVDCRLYGEKEGKPVLMREVRIAVEDVKLNSEVEIPELAFPPGTYNPVSSEVVGGGMDGISLVGEMALPYSNKEIRESKGGGLLQICLRFLFLGGVFIAGSLLAIRCVVLLRSTVR